MLAVHHMPDLWADVHWSDVVHSGKAVIQTIGVSVSGNSVPPVLPRICSRTLLDCSVPLYTRGVKQPISDLSVR